MLLESGEWRTWMVPGNHPQYARFRLLELKSLGGEYAEQKELLDSLHQRRGSDVYVATFSAVEKPDGSVFSYCLWSEGVDALLPRTQNILFHGPPGELPAVERMNGGPWERVAAVVGDLLEPVDVYPPRYRVRGFPTREQLTAIGRPDFE
jgi:hypothetical protein